MHYFYVETLSILIAINIDKLHFISTSVIFKNRFHF